MPSLFCEKQKGNSKTYCENYDQIKWNVPTQEEEMKEKILKVLLDQAKSLGW